MNSSSRILCFNECLWILKIFSVGSVSQYGILQEIIGNASFLYMTQLAGG